LEVEVPNSEGGVSSSKVGVSALEGEVPSSEGKISSLEVGISRSEVKGERTIGQRNLETQMALFGHHSN
jgi:hypothetical protein